jgi:uncharacterized membrane protein YeiH
MNMKPTQPSSHVSGAPGASRLMAAVVALSGGVVPASAHPGSPSHWVTSPDHASLLLGTGIVLWLVTRMLRDARSRRWAEVLAVALVCGAGMQWGMGR